MECHADVWHFILEKNMKTFYFVLLAMGLAACGQGSEEVKPTAPAQQETQPDPKVKIVERLKNEEYFIGENNLDKIRRHGELKSHAEKLVALLAQAEKESRGMVLNGSNLAEVKTFNEAFIAVAKSADETFGGPFLEDKAGLYQCTNAANAAYDYFTARQNQNAMVANYKQNYDNAMAACKEQIKHPPEAEATVYARKGINLPINDCLAVFTGDEPFDTFTCPMKIK
ncbi:hypothetical protein M5040_07055 [Neisseria meningitidis]|nr:hypothetical protein [Neisseria meningitidis]